MEKTVRTDWPLLFTVAGSALTIVAVCVGLWLHTDNKFTSFQIAISQDIKNIDQRNSDMMRDFHGRLCALEEKYHQLERK